MHVTDARNRIPARNYRTFPWIRTCACAQPSTTGGPRISLGDIHNMPTRSKFVYSQGFLHFSSRAPKFRSVGGGMCILFEICENRPFQKCMG